MTKLTAIIERFNAALQRAADKGLHLPNGATLATVGNDGRPSARVVLLKDADEAGFVFYTNLDSRKSLELTQHPHASMCFWWPVLEEQIRVEGKVDRVDDATADSYWNTRPRGSQIGAWASRQSEPLSSHADLVDEFERLQRQYEGKTIPRPPFWSGFRLVPERIEFWTGREDRLHVRELYMRTATGWQKSLLNP